MSLTLLKTTFKRNWIMLLIFFFVLAMYMTVIVTMYDPDSMDELMSMLDLFPPELAKAMNLSKVVTDLTGYLASWLYGMIMIGFPMVYCIILGNRLVARMVDNSSFAYLLSTPNSRMKIIFTQGFYALASVALLFAAVFGTGVFLCTAMFPDALDTGAFFRLNLTTMLVNMTAMSISFFFSCLFNETRFSLGFGAGIPIAFLLLNMLGGTSEDLKILKSISIYGLYDPVDLVQGAEVLWVNLLYAGIIIVLFAAAVIIFDRKRLPL